MSSLRLALKQSLQETTASAPGTAAAASGSNNGSSSSSENEFHYSTTATGTTGGGGGGDEDSNNNNNNSNHSSSSSNNSDHHPHSATTTTAVTNNNGRPPTPQQHPHPRRPENDDWKVAAPSEALCQRAATLGVTARDYVTAGLRVKVQFDHQYWYGGRISAVSKDASKIRIDYDDGNTETSRFPNGVIIDATDNGAHDEAVQWQAQFFGPTTGGEPLGPPLLQRGPSAAAATTPAPPLPLPTTPKPERKLQLAKGMASSSSSYNNDNSDAPDLHSQSSSSLANNNHHHKLTIAAPGPDFAAAGMLHHHKGNSIPKSTLPLPLSSLLATPTTPGSPDGTNNNNKVKRKRGRPRKHPLPLDANGEIVLRTVRSPHVPKKKIMIAAAGTTTAPVVPAIGSTTGNATTTTTAGGEAAMVATAASLSSATTTTTTAPTSTNEPKKLSIRIPLPDKVKQSLQTPKDSLIPLMEPPAVLAATKKASPSPRNSNNNNNKKIIKPKRSYDEGDDNNNVNNGGASVAAGRKTKKRPPPADAAASAAATAAAADDVKWVRCDACFKWRIIPKSAVVGEDEKWYCSNNIYDPKRASCDVPQQALKHKYKKKRQRMMIDEDSGGAAAVVAAAAATAGIVATTTAAAGGAVPSVPPSIDEKRPVGSRSPHPARQPVQQQDEEGAASVMVGVKQRRNSPPQIDELVGVSAGDDAKAVGGGGVKRTGKRLRATAEMDGDEPIVAKRGRGRPRRNKEQQQQQQSLPKTSALTAQEVSETADNLEWVQCETCGKWRKIAPHISATDLPEVWTCEMNDWNPASASCDAPEDKADGLQDTGVFGQSGSTNGGCSSDNDNNKLSYRHLIFGNTGRRVNRPVSERTRAAESIFSVQFDEEDAPTKVLYADSAFMCRGSRPHNGPDHDAANRVSVLQLMSKSNLWKELHAASKSISSNGALSRKNPPNLAVYSYENLPRDIKQPIKDLVLLLLSYESFSVHEIVQKSRSMTPQDLPENCRKAQIACTEKVIYTTLYQLMKEGKVECVHKENMANVRCFRRVLTNRAEFRRSSSRCLKIAKPWKQRAHA